MQSTAAPADLVPARAPRRLRLPPWLGSWSVPAGLRAVRAAVLLPALLALTFKAIGNPQMATYAAFGTLANLLLASFSGTRRDKLMAHIGLGLSGTVLISIGTAVNSDTALAAAVTLVVTFVVLLAGVTGPNVAGGGLAAMVVFVLSAASPGAASMIPSRLEGWWLATGVATLVVVIMSPARVGDQLRAAMAASARALGREAGAAATDTATPSLRSESVTTQQRLRALFNSSPYRPTGPAAADQALGAMVELLEWVGAMVDDTVGYLVHIDDLDYPDRELLACAGEVLEAVAGLLLGGDVSPDLDRLQRLRRASADAVGLLGGDGSASGLEATVHASFHARTIAVAVRTVATDALIATRKASIRTVGQQRLAWVPRFAPAPSPVPSPGLSAGGEDRGGGSGLSPGPSAGLAPGLSAGLSAGGEDRGGGSGLSPGLSPGLSAGGEDRGAGAGTAILDGARRRRGLAKWADELVGIGVLLARQASTRSVWVRNAARGAVAVTAAVTFADLTNVQHGFWVVLGTLSVLRTTASATGGTAIRALVGTAIGFAVGAAVVLAVGTDTTVLWLVLPLAVLVAAYAPGVAPFAVGQGAFTVMIVVLYNLLIPIGWKVGVIRVEDVAVGCVISFVAGAVFWPRGATAVVADDLRDALVSAAAYLVESAGWALGLRDVPPASGRAAVVTSLRLDDAVRAFLTEQGTKAIAKEDLWALVGALQRLRLTAAALAELPPPPASSPVGVLLSERAQLLADWYATVAAHIDSGHPPQLLPLDTLPPLEGSGSVIGHLRACQVYVDQHLRHLHRHHSDLIEPATRLSEAAGRAWWRPGPAPNATVGVGANVKV